MKNIAELDKNFKIETNIDRDNLKFYNATDSNFSLHGVFHDGEGYVRMPKDAATATSKGVEGLFRHTAGGRLRFKTNSKYIAIHMKVSCIRRMVHMPLTGNTGFDLYVDGKFYRTFIPPVDAQNAYSGIHDLENQGSVHEIVINFPLYNEVDELYIGLEDTAEILPPEEYATALPVVYYGSSITQGGCASRPGMSYQAILSNALNIDHINLGFSGNAKGEQVMADYIANLKMSAFVLDYDHNAPNVEHLKATHEPFFKTIRNANPVLPILILSKPKYYLTDDDIARRETIEQTYKNAVANGDKNVYFIEGNTLMREEIAELGTVDGCHPTDLGFFSIAKRIEPILKEMLKL